jgi:hypothetical protein
VILTVHELKRLARNAAELMTLSATLQAGDIQLELLSGPLTGVYDPGGMGSMLFAVLAVAAQPGTTSARRPWRARSSPRARAPMARARRSSTTTCSSLAAR